jgi:hypothetical protein
VWPVVTALATNPDLRSYDTIVVAFSGGKDSIGCLLSLIEAGAPPERIELHHHDVDGQGEPFMDCVSRNYRDRKWRIVCDPRPFEQQPTFKSREEAATAEWNLVQTLTGGAA